MASVTSSAIRESLTVLERTSDWTAYRDAYQDLSSALLDEMFPEWQRSVFTSVEIPDETLKVLTQYAKGGKKMRGAMVLLGYQCAGGTDLDTIMRSSVAYELIHSAFLIHDDIMDRSKTRRNLETAHVAFSKLGQLVGAEDPDQFGVSMAINTGDIHMLSCLLHEHAQLQFTAHIRSCERYLIKQPTGQGIGHDVSNLCLRLSARGRDQHSCRQSQFWRKYAAMGSQLK